MLISHHPPSQYDRTYSILGVLICARCSGILSGLIFNSQIDLLFYDWIFFLLPLPSYLNFLFQELNYIKSLNLLKSTLSIPLGFFLYQILNMLYYEKYVYSIVCLGYLFFLNFIVVFVLLKNGKMEKLVQEYELGIYDFSKKE